jgi:5,10-methylenetetrahydromethanopterin reductase
VANELGVPVGFGVGTEMRSVREVRAQAVWAAEAGFDSFWVSQIFGVDPIVALAAIAGDIPTLREVGTSVVPMAGRHPLALAAQARTAQDALGGRFTLGLGPSHELVVEGFYGERYGSPFTRTVEYLAALLPLLHGEKAEVNGSQVRANGWLTIDADPCPLLLAALGPRMLDFAGRVCAGTTVGQCGPRTIAAHVAPIITEAAERADRAAPRIMALVSVAVTDDREAAHAAAVEAGQLYASLPSYRAVLDREGVASGADLFLLGSMDEIVEGLERYVAAGATDLRIGIGSADEAVIEGTRDGLASWLS